MGHLHRVVYLDDDPVLRTAVTRLGLNFGFDITSVATADELLSALESPGAEAAVVDFHLRHETTAPLVRTLMAREVPILVLTGAPDDARRELGALAAIAVKGNVPDLFDSLTKLVAQAAR